MGRRIVLQSPLTPDAIALKLREVLGGRGAAPKKGVSGNGSEAEMTLFYFRPNIQNSFQSALTATMEPSAGGTRIEGRMGTPRSARAFMGCWFGFLTLFVAAAGGGMIVSGAPLRDMLPFVAIPLGMMVFGGVLYCLGTWTAKKDEAAILAFLATTVAARPAGD